MTMKIRALLVDDEPLARERLRQMLQSESDIEVAAEAANGPEALTMLRRHRPDLVFLDIQMPGMDGFEVLRALEPGQLPQVIFVTAYDQHALRAFEVHALDYLLKPFKPARFRAALQRARETLARANLGDASKNLLALLGQSSRSEAEHLTRIPVKTADRLVFVKTSQIDYIESAGNYVVLHAGKENHVVRETLSDLEAKLDPKSFLRISRSTLVNLEQIKELQPLFKGEYTVVLHNGKQLPMTRGIREVQEVLKFS